MSEQNIDAELRWACQNGEVEKITKYFNDGGNVNHQIKGRGLLHIAADYGQLEVIKALVGKGVDVNVPDKFGVSGLLAAIFEGHTECVKFLLDNGASKTGKAPDGSPFIDCAEKQDIKDLLK